MTGRYGRPRQYMAAYILGLLVVVMTVLRIEGNFSGKPDRLPALLALGFFSTLLLLEFLFSARARWSWTLYFCLQAVCLVFMAALDPFLDVTTSLYLSLFTQAYYFLPRRQAFNWALIFVILLTASLVRGLGPLDGLAQSMLITAEAIILTTFSRMVVQAHNDREESQTLVAELQEAHRRLQEYASQVGQLAAEGERNRLSRELHDSVGQIIFSIELGSESARLMLEHDPSRFPAMLDRLQEMTGTALGQLRSIIAELRPRT